MHILTHMDLIVTFNVITLQNEFAENENNLSPEAMAIAVDWIKSALVIEGTSIVSC